MKNTTLLRTMTVLATALTFLPLTASGQVDPTRPNLAETVRQRFELRRKLRDARTAGERQAILRQMIAMDIPPAPDVAEPYTAPNVAERGPDGDLLVDAWSSDLEDARRDAVDARRVHRQAILAIKSLEFAQAFTRALVDTEPYDDGSLWQRDEIVGQIQDLEYAQASDPDSPSLAEEIEYEGSRRALTDILEWMDAEGVESIGAEALHRRAGRFGEEHNDSIADYERLEQTDEILAEVLERRNFVDQGSDEELEARRRELEFFVENATMVRGFDPEMWAAERELFEIEKELEQRPWRNRIPRGLLYGAELEIEENGVSDATQIRTLLGAAKLELDGRGVPLRDNAALAESSAFSEILRAKPGQARAEMIVEWFALASRFEGAFAGDPTEDAFLRSDLRAKGSMLLVAEARNLVDLYRQSATAGNPGRAVQLARVFELLLDPGTAIDNGSMRSTDELVERNLSLFLAQNLAVLEQIPDDAALQRLELEDPAAAGRIKHRLQGTGAVIAAFDQANRDLTGAGIARAEAVQRTIEEMFEIGIECLPMGKVAGRIPALVFAENLEKRARDYIAKSFPDDLFPGRDRIVGEAEAGLRALARAAAAPAFEAGATLLGDLSPAEYVRRQRAKWEEAQVERRGMLGDVFDGQFRLDDPERANLQSQVRLGMGLAIDAHGTFDND